MAAFRNRCNFPPLLSAVGDQPDASPNTSTRLQIAEAIEKVFQPLKTERLIRLGTTCGKNESQSVPLRFHCFTPPICRGFFDSLSQYRT
jgi:hypothetical protein